MGVVEVRLIGVLTRIVLKGVLAAAVVADAAECTPVAVTECPTVLNSDLSEQTLNQSVVQTNNYYRRSTDAHRADTRTIASLWSPNVLVGSSVNPART